MARPVIQAYFPKGGPGATGRPPHVDPVRLGLVVGGGQRLPGPVQARMEAVFRSGFSDVRVHVGGQAERIGAVAFTTGSQIYFASGSYQPETQQGLRLLGHELAHVVQQRQGRVRTAGGPGTAIVHDTALETEAARWADRAVAAGPVGNIGRTRLSPVGTVGAAGGPRVAQMSPGSWRQTGLVTRLLGYRGSRLYWQPIRDKIEEYLRIHPDEHDRRRNVLDEIGRRIDAWEQNQQTARVWFKGIRDEKRADLQDLRGLIEAERGELRRPEARPTLPQPIGRTAAIPVAEGARPQVRSTTIASSLEPLPDTFRPLAPQTVDKAKRAAFDGLQVYIHYTKEAYRGGIHVGGLVPGRSQGIGEVSTTGEKGQPDRENVYVLSGSAPSDTVSPVKTESGGAPIAVVSRNRVPDRDPNYQGAYRFHGTIPTGRDYTINGNAQAICLALPLTEAARQGLANFVNQGTPQHLHITAAEAEYLLAERLAPMSPILFRGFGVGLGRT